MLFHAPFDHFGDCKGGNIVGIFAGTEACVEAKLLGKLVGDTGAASADNEPVTQPFSFEKLDEFG